MILPHIFKLIVGNTDSKAQMKQSPGGAAKPHKSRSLQFPGGCTVLSISPSSSILSEQALNALKYAFLMNRKVGVSGSPASIPKPSEEHIDKAEAAYDIARELVDWSENYVLCEDVPVDDHKTSEVKRKPDPDMKQFDTKLIDSKLIGLDIKLLDGKFDEAELKEDFIHQEDRCSSEFKPANIDSRPEDVLRVVIARGADRSVRGTERTERQSCPATDFFGEFPGAWEDVAPFPFLLDSPLSDPGDDFLSPYLGSPISPNDLSFN